MINFIFAIIYDFNAVKMIIKANFAKCVFALKHNEKEFWLNDFK